MMNEEGKTIAELLDRVSELEKQNQQREAEIENVVKSANKRVSDVLAELHKMRIEHSQAQMNFTRLEARVRSLSHSAA